LFVVMGVAVVALVGLTRGLTWVRGGIRAFMSQQREKKTRRGLVALGDGFAAVHAGHAVAARRLAKEATALLSDNPAVQMLRKQVAALHGDDAELRAVAETLLERPETEIAALKTLADTAKARGNHELALSYARRALARGDHIPWALRMILDVDIATRNWTNALAILDMKASRDMFAPSEQQYLRARFHTFQAQDLLAQGQAAAAARVAHAAMDENGGTAAAAVYGRAMAAQGKGHKAVTDVARAWAHHPDPALLEVYRALVPGESALEFAQRVEQLVRGNPDHVESKLAVAEASLAAELWGQARHRLTGLTGEANAPHVRVRAARLMAEVERSERGDSAAVSRWLREALAAEKIAIANAGTPTSLAALLADA